MHRFELRKKLCSLNEEVHADTEKKIGTVPMDLLHARDTAN